MLPDVSPKADADRAHDKEVVGMVGCAVMEDPETAPGRMVMTCGAVPCGVTRKYHMHVTECVYACKVAMLCCCVRWWSLHVRASVLCSCAAWHTAHGPFNARDGHDHVGTNSRNSADDRSCFDRYGLRVWVCSRVRYVLHILWLLVAGVDCRLLGLDPVDLKEVRRPCKWQLQPARLAFESEWSCLVLPAPPAYRMAICSGLVQLSASGRRLLNRVC